MKEPRKKPTAPRRKAAPKNSPANVPESTGELVLDAPEKPKRKRAPRAPKTALSDASISRVGLDALLYIPGRIVPAIAQILTVTVITHYFTVESENIARYDLTFRFVLFLSTFTFVWLNVGILRFYSSYNKPSLEPIFFGVMGLLKYVTVCVGVVIAGLVWAFVPDEWFGVGLYRDLLLSGTTAFVAYSFYETGLAVLRAKRKPLVFSMATTLSAGLRLPLAVAMFTVFGFGISGIFWATAIMYLVAYWLFIQRHVGSPALVKSPKAKKLLREILFYGAPIWISQFLNFCLGNADRYFLQALPPPQGSTQVGFYAVCSLLVEQPMSLVFQTFALAVFPAVASVWERRGREATEDLVSGVTRLFFLLCIPLMVLLGVLSQPLFAVFARGDAYLAYEAGPLVVTASFFYGLSYFANYGLHLSRKTHLLLLITIVALAVNIALNWYVIPEYGYKGAAAVRVASNILLVLGFAAGGHSYLHWRLQYGSIARISLAALAAGAVAYGLERTLPHNVLTLAIMFGTGGVTYGVLLLAMREVPLSELFRGFAWLRRRRAA